MLSMRVGDAAGELKECSRLPAIGLPRARTVPGGDGTRLFLSLGSLMIDQPQNVYQWPRVRQCAVLTVLFVVFASGLLAQSSQAQLQALAERVGTLEQKIQISMRFEHCEVRQDTADGQRDGFVDKGGQPC